MYLKNDIDKDKILTWNDVEFDTNNEIIKYRHQMENNLEINFFIGPLSNLQTKSN